jgi:fructose-1,6-bisphosphatase II
MELARVTEAAAMLAARWMGRGDKNAADQAAVDAMRAVLGTIQMDGVVVIGEGEKDEAPMLFVGEQVGNAEYPKVDIAVDPIDGTRLTSLGMPNAISVVALAERGALFASPDIMYMEKIAVGAEAVDAIDITDDVETNLVRVAKAKSKSIHDLTVVVLDRPRHEELVREIRAAGARIKMIPDGDVAGAIMTTTPDSGVDVLMGIGGAPEAVIAACAMKCAGGSIQTRLWPRNDQERAVVAEQHIDVSKILHTSDLVRGEEAFFSATGITDGELVRGVRFYGATATTETLVMRSKSGTVRRIQATHRFSKLREFSRFSYD